jgi:hypothetical protein
MESGVLARHRTVGQGETCAGGTADDEFVSGHFVLEATAIR